MDINQFDGARAYTQALKNAGNGLGTTQATEKAPKTEFSALVEGAIDNVKETSAKMEAEQARAVTGAADIVDVVTAVSNAEMAVETVVTVRDKVISAYNDIIKMPV